MEQRRLIIAMVIAMTLILLWQPAFFWIGKKLGYDMSAPPPATTAPSAVVDATASNSAAPATASTTAAATTGPMSAMLHAMPATNSGQGILIGSGTAYDKQYKMGVMLDAAGAGIARVDLNEFTHDALTKDLYSFEQPYAGFEIASRPLATRAVFIDDVEVPLSDLPWTLESSAPDQATYNLTIYRGETPVLRLRKLLQVLPSSDASQGYELAVAQSFENLTPQEMKVRTRFNGPTVPPSEQERGHDRQIIAGYGAKGFVLVNHNYVEDFVKTPTKAYAKDDGGNPIVWLGTSSTYFNALFRPLPSDASQQTADYLSAATATSLDTTGQQVALSFETTNQTLTPGKPVELAGRVFFGPRQRSLLNGDYYASFPNSYDKTLVLTSGPCSYCTFDWLVTALVKLLQGLHYIFGGFAGHGDWGLAIIALVIIVRAILHPITKRSQIAMSRMSKMGPEIERLKKKHGDNKEELNRAMMEVYKEQGVAPILGCLPMILQMPIWIALWQSLQTTFELRHAPFLWGWTWIHDLSKPDHFLTLANPINVRFLPTISGLNILPIFMGVVFYLQMKFQPKAATMTPEQEQQQKMMQFMMPFIFPLMLYSGPSGLNLYIMTSTGIGILESKIVRDHIKQREEEEKAGKIIVDGGKKLRGSAGRTDTLGTAKPTKAGGIMGWLASLQQRAEEIRRDAEKRK